jgi:hypothetical protein
MPSGEARKAFIWLGIAGLIVLAVFLAQPLLVIFGGVVFASLIEGGQRLLGGSSPARALCGSRLVLAAAVAFWSGWPPSRGARSPVRPPSSPISSPPRPARADLVSGAWGSSARPTIRRSPSR